ncbi:MAG: hypothetical protein ACYDAY_03865 [Candidatus Dormibacteria bacterium]
MNRVALMGVSLAALAALPSAAHASTGVDNCAAQGTAQPVCYFTASANYRGTIIGEGNWTVVVARDNGDGTFSQFQLDQTSGAAQAFNFQNGDEVTVYAYGAASAVAVFGATG